jgi:hypothetical protein
MALVHAQGTSVSRIPKANTDAIDRAVAIRQREAERALSLAQRQSRMSAARVALAEYGMLRANISDSQKALVPMVDMAGGSIVEAEAAPVYFIRADRLAEYRVVDPASGLLRETGQRAYPVLAGGRAQMAVMIEPGGTTWEPSEFGSQQLANQIHAAWSGVPGSIGAVSVIRIPALSLEFVGLYATDGLQLIPVVDAPSFGFHAGERLNAATTLARLAPRAQEVRALPR